jgi:hypothetical protein
MMPATNDGQIGVQAVFQEGAVVFMGVNAVAGRDANKCA